MAEKRRFRLLSEETVYVVGLGHVRPGEIVELDPDSVSGSALWESAEAETAGASKKPNKPKAEPPKE